MSKSTLFSKIQKISTRFLFKFLSSLITSQFFAYLSRIYGVFVINKCKKHAIRQLRCCRPERFDLTNLKSSYAFPHRQKVDLLCSVQAPLVNRAVLPALDKEIGCTTETHDFNKIRSLHIALQTNMNLRAGNIRAGWGFMPFLCIFHIAFERILYTCTCVYMEKQQSAYFALLNI